jgi:hypothetical protein
VFAEYHLPILCRECRTGLVSFCHSAPGPVPATSLVADGQ